MPKCPALPSAHRIALLEMYAEEAAETDFRMPLRIKLGLISLRLTAACKVYKIKSTMWWRIDYYKNSKFAPTVWERTRYYWAAKYTKLKMVCSVLFGVAELKDDWHFRNQVQEK